MRFAPPTHCAEPSFRQSSGQPLALLHTDQSQFLQLLLILDDSLNQGNCLSRNSILKEAAKIQFSINQPIIIYYGNEIGMSQDKSIWEFITHGDLQARKPMDWKNRDMDLFSFYKKLIKKRKENNLN